MATLPVGGPYCCRIRGRGTGKSCSLKFVRPRNSVERSRCFRMTAQANLPRSLTATWSGGGGGIWSARVSYTDHHSRLNSCDRMRSVALRAKPIAVIGEFSSAPRPVRRVTSNRREQEQSALAQLSEQAITCGVCALGYHRNLTYIRNGRSKGRFSRTTVTI